MKKVISLILCVLMLGSCFAFADTIEGSRTVIGADLDADEVASVYKEFGISQGDVKELTVTNAEEREYLKGLVASSAQSPSPAYTLRRSAKARDLT